MQSTWRAYFPAGSTGLYSVSPDDTWEILRVEPHSRRETEDRTWTKDVYRFNQWPTNVNLPQYKNRKHFKHVTSLSISQTCSGLPAPTTMSLPSSRPTRIWLLSFVTDTQRTGTFRAKGPAAGFKLHTKTHTHAQILEWDTWTQLSETYCDDT